ncbi:MAG: DUF3307 domain-containing protein [Hyphomicrobium sp.]
MGADMTAADAVSAVLLATIYLMAKHWIADFVLQTEHQRTTKGIYGATGGLTHGLTHMLATAPVFLLVPVPVAAVTALGLVVAEFIVHYHIDWAKEQIVRRSGWTLKDTHFWWTLGFDQLLHGLTYVAMLWVLFSSPAA